VNDGVQTSTIATSQNNLIHDALFETILDRDRQIR
jgi:hypothetical protein